MDGDCESAGASVLAGLVSDIGKVYGQQSHIHLEKQHEPREQRII
jgi:hypothetical protein